jgi:hypothetical protein
MQKQNIISIILGVSTTLFIVMISLPPQSKSFSMQQLSSVQGDVIEEEQPSNNSLNDHLTNGTITDIQVGPDDSYLYILSLKGGLYRILPNTSS